MRVLPVFLLLLIAAAPVSAQEAAAPSHISFVDGSATVFHADDDSEPAVVNMPIVQGDRVQTLGRSRVEVMFPDGASIVIDPDSDVEFVTATRVRVVAGAIEHRQAAVVDQRSPSVQNLPPDLQPYGPEFDQYGAWQYEPQYGNVWYPTAVGADWRPYYDGYWSSYPAYGWTWIGYERWAWPTHHYGRWGYARSRWFWIPGRSFGAAWVSWGTAPDYVSWCPLGYDGRPVVALSIGFRSSWDAWTVIPRDRFGYRGYSSRRYAVEPRRLATSVAFIEHRNPPTRQQRGSFTVGNRDSAVYGRQSTVGGRQPATAVPRGEYRGGTAGYDRRAESPQRVEVAPIDRSAAITTPGWRERRGDGGRAAPGGNQQPSISTDHPAYQPQYEPQYQPRYQPRYEAPSDRAPSQPGYRERPSYRDNRPQAAPHDTGPAANARPSPAPRAESRPAPPERTSAPAREPHARGGQDGSPNESRGTAVRRPR